MKSQAGRILSVGFAVTAAVALYAQSKAVTADVPFNFYVGSRLMAQGNYQVDETAGGIAFITAKREAATQAVTTINVTGKKEYEPARLVFRCYGQEYFLAEIWTGDGPTGRAITPTQHEKDLVRNGTAPTLAVVRIALHR